MSVIESESESLSLARKLLSVSSSQKTERYERQVKQLPARRCSSIGGALFELQCDSEDLLRPGGFGVSERRSNSTDGLLLNDSVNGIDSNSREGTEKSRLRPSKTLTQLRCRSTKGPCASQQQVSSGEANACRGRVR